MTLSDLRTLMSKYELMLDNYEGAATDAERNTQINWAYRNICKRVHILDPRVTLTLTTDVRFYDLRDTTVVSKRVVKVHKVIIDGNPLRDYKGQYGLWNMLQLEAEAPDWRTAASGTPRIAVQYKSDGLLLHPAPSAVGSNNFIEGTVLPADLSADTDEPDLPVEMHEAIALDAVIKAAAPSLADQEQLMPLQATRAIYEPMIQELENENKRAILGNFQDWGSDYPRWIKL